MSILKIYIILYERVVFSLGQLESESYIFFLLIIIGKMSEVTIQINHLSRDSYLARGKQGALY